ncbi:MAG: SWIM zinc finger family protein [Candidatus Poribacteria bacterium]|nr:SWIM zinc finger family protein [Candidatus Poribacteria bacterium]
MSFKIPFPNLTRDQIRQRCTAQSFERGSEYFRTGTIGNPVLHGWTLSAKCYGSDTVPYSIAVKLMPTTIADTSCSCPYSGQGDCKHIVALLLTYTEAPEIISSVDTLLATLAEKPKEKLIRVISELLKRTPALAPIARVYADMPTESDLEMAPTAHKLKVCGTVTVYRERIDHIFGRDFLEQHRLQQVLVQLEGLVQHAESLTELGETGFALSMLHALIHQSIVRHPDTLQKSELPRFVGECTKAFAQIAENAQESTAIGFSTATLLEHCQMLLDLSFDAEPVFTPHLTRLLEQLSSKQAPIDLASTIEQHLDESPDRQAHVQLLLTLYSHTNRTEDYLHLARCEGESYRLIHALFTRRHDAAAWQAIEEFSLSVDEYAGILRIPIVSRMPEFTDKLLRLVKNQHPNTAIILYQRLIEQAIFFRKREGYEKARRYLTELKTLYEHCGQENQWTVYLADFRKQHARKRLLLQIISV